MTTLEAIREDLRPYPVRSSLIERKCEKHGLEPNAAVHEEKTISIIVVEILSQMLMMNNVGEGGVSISFDREAVETVIRRLCKEAGLNSFDYIKEPTVKFLGEL